MANSKSALKRVRQNTTRNERNTNLKTRVKTTRKKVTAAAEAGNKEETAKAISAYASAVDMCAKNNIFHKNKAANLKSKAVKAVVKATA